MKKPLLTINEDGSLTLHKKLTAGNLRQLGNMLIQTADGVTFEATPPPQPDVVTVKADE